MHKLKVAIDGQVKCQTELKDPALGSFALLQKAMKNLAPAGGAVR